MKYNRGINYNITYDKVVKYIKPILNIIVCSTVLLAFLIFSYNLILGPENEIKISEVKKADKNSSQVSGESIKKEESIQPTFSSINIDTVSVYISEEKKIEKIPIEEYIKGVVSSEMPLNFSKEALKAQAIAARTYTVSRIQRGSGCAKCSGAYLCDTIHCQVYTPKDKKIAQLGSEGENKWALVEQVVEETKDMVLTYDGSVIEGAFYFSTSSGKTENVEDVFSNSLPYLKSVESLGEEIAPRYKESKTLDNNRFVEAINNNYVEANLSATDLQNKVKINSYTDGGCVKDITLGGVSISGVDFRKLFGLNSANFTIEFLNNEVVVNCTGFGHGVGMSQWGANVMAVEGKKCEEILKHYYTGIEINKINQ